MPAKANCHFTITDSAMEMSLLLMATPRFVRCNFKLAIDAGDLTDAVIGIERI